MLALLVAGFSVSVRTEIRSASAAVESARAEAMADAAIHLAIQGLIADRATGAAKWRIAPDGTPRFCVLDKAMLRISIEDEGGKIDLNAANDRLLRATLMGLGLSEADAAAQTDAIIDFRDPDDQRRSFGAERDEYIAAGLLNGPKNAPFARVEELAQVLGVQQATLGRLLPFLSAHSGQPGLDATMAAPALKALVAQGYGKLSGRGGIEQPQISGAEDRLPVEFAMTSPQRVFAIRAEARTLRESLFVREAVVELSRSRAGLIYSIREWRRGRGVSPDFKSNLLGSTLDPC